MPEPTGQVGDASRRTRLAGERTQLAWWRTGLTALAVAIGIGRVVPELDPSAAELPYALVGAGFAAYGVALIAYGTRRSRAIDDAIAAGVYVLPADKLLSLLTVVGSVLGIATGALIILG